MLLHCKVFNVFHMVISILFFASPYNLFVFQSTITNWSSFFLFSFFLSTLYYFVLVFFYTISIGNLLFSKIWWWFYDIKYALLVFFFNLVFLTWFVLYFILPLMHWVWEWVFPYHSSFYLFNLGKILYLKFF